MLQIQNPSGKAGTSAYGGTYLQFDDAGMTTVKGISAGLDRWLRLAGYKITDLDKEPEAAIGYHPADHKVEDVLKYLAEADADERERVLALETAGKARNGILGFKEAPDGE